MTTMQDAITTYAGIAFERQLHLGKLIGEKDFSYRLDTGQLTFSDKLTFNAEILGSEAQGPGTWLWGWANTASGIPEERLRLGKRLRTYGEKNGLAAFAQAEVPLDAMHNGHHFAMVASGILDIDAYYRIPYDGGALFVLIEDPAVPADTRDPLQRVTFTFPQVIASITLSDHRAALRAYLNAHNLTIVSDEPDKLEVKGAHDQKMIATFDGQDRLTDMIGTTKGS